MPQATADPVADLLMKAPPPVRADAWDAFHTAKNADEFATAIKAMPIADSVKADLWDLKQKQNVAPDFTQTDTTPNEVDPNTLGTFASHVGAQINPVPLGQMIPFPKAAGGAGMDAPVQVVKGFAQKQQDLYDQMKTAYHSGDLVTAGEKALTWALNYPSLGAANVLDQAGTSLKQGHYAAAAGDMTGFVGTMLAPEAAASLRKSAGAARVAEVASDAADSRFADVMSPKGSSKAILRTGKQAENVATAVRHGTSAITPGGLQQQIASRLGQADDALGAAYQAIPKTVGYPVSPLLTKLQGALDALKMNGTGGSVIPQTLTDRAAALKQAITEVKKIGPFTNTDNLAQLRNSWKGAARDAFVPSLNPNFQQIRESAKGWADAWSAVQDTLTDRHPELKSLNADFHIWKSAHEAMEALADQQRSKPTVGRTIMAQAGGAIAGGTLGGGIGAVAGELIGPTVERGLSSTVAPATKMIIARQFGNLADAIRNNQTTRIEIVLKQLRPLLLSHLAGESAPNLIPATAEGSERPKE